MTIRFLAVFLIAAAGLCGPAAGPLLAQQQTPSEAQAAPDYREWETVATRAEDVLQTDRAANAALEQLRGQLADWRSRFLSAQDINAARIKTLRDQISALGAPPAEGESEPDEIARRRSELNQQLAELQAPGLKAVEAYSRADGLIREIDSIIRERQANQLLQLGPSPINPANWDDGLAALRTTALELGREVSDNWRTPSARAKMREDLPATLLFLALAGILLARGRRWMEQLTMRMVRGGPARGRAAFSGIASLGQIILPLMGVFLLAKALQSSAMLGIRADRIVQLLPMLGLTVLAARWLGGRVFAEDSVTRRIFTLTPERQAEGRISSGLMGLVLALAILVGSVANFESASPEALAVITFPVLLVAGLMLSRMGQLLLAHARADSMAHEDRPYRNRVMLLLGRAAITVGLVGPALAAIGYTDAADFFVYPSILTLALLGLLLVLQRFVTDVYNALIQNPADPSEDASDALIPVLIGLVLGLLALPVLALIWGARVADLTEIWSRFTSGFAIGDTRISPTDFLTFAVVFGFGYMLTRLVQGTLRSTVLPKTKIDPGGQTALVSGVGYVGIFLAGIISVTSAGIDLSSLAIVAGALSVGIGFGLQNIVSNFVSGIILLIERPVSQGDWIEVGGVMGTVQDISVRSTRIQTFDRTDVVVPNSDLITGMVTNWTRSNLTGRVILAVGVAYGTDTRKVERILREIGEAHPLVMTNPPPTVVFQGFGADALDFELRVILRDINFGLGVRTELNHEIARRFAEEGIEIPFAQRDIWLRNPEALRAAAAAPLPSPQPAAAGPAQPTVREIDNDADAGDGR
ncbi:MAG: mechanosensitive ion channel family protein [Rhodobacteraceae bacterium]|nr:mechanosensitive ion channel family protein [Paracoccaceae bacterium]